jgi:hypothetical protein
MTQLVSSHHLPKKYSQLPQIGWQCFEPISIEKITGIIKMIPASMVQPFKPGSCNTLFIQQSEFNSIEYILYVSGTNCMGDDVVFSVQLFSYDSSNDMSQRWLIEYRELSSDRAISFITKSYFARVIQDNGIILQNTRDGSAVVTAIPHMASPKLLHGSGIYFQQIEQDAVDYLITNITEPHVLTTLVNLSAKQYNHSALLAPSEGNILLINALNTLLSDHNNRKVLVIIANLAACEATRPVLLGMTFLSKLVSCLLSSDPIIKTLSAIILSFINSTHVVNLEPFREQLQPLLETD